MSIASDRFPDVSLLTETSQILIDRSERVERLWAKKVRDIIPASRTLLDPILMNTFPTFIANLAEALSPNYPRQTATENNTVAEAHGRERFNMTEYSLAQVVTEYVVIRDVISEVLDENNELTKEELKIIERSIIFAIQGAVSSFAAIQDDLRRTFIATLSHDIRSPISTIKMASDLLLGEIQHDSDSSELVGMIASNAEKADDLLVSVLNSSLAANNSKIKLHIVGCCINDIVERCVQQFRLRAKGGIVFRGERVEGQWSVRDLERSLDNLISNAIKYGDKTKPVEISVSKHNERMMLTVHNKGKAIPKTEQNKIFLPYERSKSAQGGLDEGWGLGLPYVLAVVEAHGGSLLVDSSPKLGTTFTIDIPIESKKFYI